MSACDHSRQVTGVKITRLTADESPGSEIVEWRADISIKCTDCGMAYRFRGELPLGYITGGASLSADRTELRIAIEPVADHLENSMGLH